MLLGGALAAGVAALPAHAQTFQDTALSAGPVTVQPYGGSALKAVNGPASTPGVINLSGTGVTTWSLHGTVPTGVSLSSTTSGAATISYTGLAVTTPPEIVADATDSAGSAEAIEFTVTITANSIQMTTSGTFATVTVTGLADANTAGTVTFTATSNETPPNTIAIGESNLPAGLTSGNPLTFVGGTAAPGTYGGVRVTATDSDGAVQNGAFTLTVSANVISNFGDMVNRFGNGFDTFQQRDRAGAIVAGWTATQRDPATHFIRNAGTHTGAFQFEYAPNGGGSGLCISDPGGGWPSDPLRDGLILTPCNIGPWQQFVPQSDGTLVNVATGLTIDPNGTGSQLRGGSGPVPWGGSVYTWTGFSSLPV